MKNLFTTEMPQDRFIGFIFSKLEVRKKVEFILSKKIGKANFNLYLGNSVFAHSNANAIIGLVFLELV